MRLSGRFRSALIIGGQGIRARKLRTFLSMISLFLGVLAVVTVQASADITGHAALADVELHGGKDGTLQVFLPSQGQVVPVTLEVLQGKPDAVALTGTNAIIGEPGVAPINPGGGPLDGDGFSSMVCDPRGSCFRGDGPPGTNGSNAPSGKAIELRLVGMTGDIRQFRPFRTRSGSWLDFGSAPSLAPRLVLNTAAAKGFTTYHVPAEMRLDGASANPTPQFIGVVDDGQVEPTAYARADELTNWLPGTNLKDNRGEGIQVLLAPGATAVEHTLRARLVAAGVAADQIHIERINSRKEIASQLELIRWIFLGMAALVLLIGVAGILNVGLATVGERIEEFALRRAVGTSRLLLAGIVLAETLLTGLLTAAAAIGVGIGGLKVASLVLAGRGPFAGEAIAFPWQAGVAGIIAGLAAGVLGGLIPAIRAARIPIATVMRA
jgi:putative ABC transport system permease protein